MMKKKKNRICNESERETKNVTKNIEYECGVYGFPSCFFCSLFLMGNGKMVHERVAVAITAVSFAAMDGYLCIVNF